MFEKMSEMCLFDFEFLFEFILFNLLKVFLNNNEKPNYFYVMIQKNYEYIYIKKKTSIFSVQYFYHYQKTQKFFPQWLKNVS